MDQQSELHQLTFSVSINLPVYLTEGTHTYKFVVDGKWLADENNRLTVPDGHGGFNSVIQLGEPYIFTLDGFENAKEVVLAGSFNGWKEGELILKKTPTGWQLPYVLGPGNYEYKFKVDGKWIHDPKSNFNSNSSGNSYIFIKPNYTFKVKGFKDAKSVFLSGDFNNWDPRAYPMKREGDEWVFTLNLGVGKHRYKFIADDKWLLDPTNKLWEQNEYGTGNSVLWIEK